MRTAVAVLSLATTAFYIIDLVFFLDGKRYHTALKTIIWYVGIIIESKRKNNTNNCEKQLRLNNIPLLCKKTDIFKIETVQRHDNYDSP